MSHKKGNDNELLVEFDFLVDLDMALFRLVKDKYSNSEYVDKNIINMNNEYRIIRMLLYRKHINPLEILMPSIETTKLYKEFHNDSEEELLKYALLHDTFYLMITFLNNASSLSGITVWCKNQLEADFIKEKNDRLQTIVIPSRQEIDLSKYTSIYMKFFAYAIEYKNLAGKNIYIANAKYNYDEDRNIINTPMSILVGDVNIIRLIDLYTKVKYRPTTEGDNNNEDILKHSTGTESPSDSEGNAWYNFGFPK